MRLGGSPELESVDRPTQGGIVPISWESWLMGLWLKSETCFLNMELCLGGIAVGGSIFYVELEEAVRRPDANLSLERVKMSHFEGSKLYHRGPFR